MSKSFHLVLFCLLTIPAAQAQNLVPNASFESFSNQFCGLMVPADFNQSMINWYTPSVGSPDTYYTNITNSCYNYQPNSQYSGIIGIKGNQTPRTGEAMVGIHAYTILGQNQREYIQVELVSPLTVGFYYVVDYYVSLADSVEFSVDNISALFSVGQVASSNDNVLNYSPQISYTGGFLDNVSEWTLISDTLLAQEAFTHLTIGNFRNDNMTNTLANPGASGNVGTYGAYYYIDDIRVEEVRGLSTINRYEQDQLSIYPNPANNEVSVEYNGDISAVEIELFNNLGQRVSCTPSLSEFRKMKFHVSHLENGMYILKIKNDLHDKTVKIIVNH